MVTGVQYDGDQVLTQGYDSGYRLTSQTFGNDLTRNLTYNRDDNLRTNDKVTGIAELNFDYTYAADKNVLSETSTGGILKDLGFTADYDPGNRIANWSRSGQIDNSRENQSWNYDNAGNWAGTTIDGDTLNRTNNASDEVTAIDGDSLSYSSRGNLTEDEDGQTYTWDLDNRIAEIEGQGFDDISYQYDSFGRRVLKEQHADREVLLWWGKEEYAEHRSIGSQPVIQNDLHDHPNKLNTTFGRALEGDKNDIQYFHKNYLGHVYAVSDDGGNIIEHYRYTAFGEPEVIAPNGEQLSNSAIDNDILWNVKRYDWDSGIYLYMYRHYDAERGRWLSRDPIEEWGGVGLYVFLLNDSMNLIDIYGNGPFGQAVGNVVGGFLGAVGGAQAGAALLGGSGTLVAPGLGTISGGAVGLVGGGVVGGSTGWLIGGALGDLLEDYIIGLVAPNPSNSSGTNTNTNPDEEEQPEEQPTGPPRPLPIPPVHPDNDGVLCNPTRNEPDHGPLANTCGLCYYRCDDGTGSWTVEPVHEGTTYTRCPRNVPKRIILSTATDYNPLPLP